ncbi:MAG TPA: TetR/AcrR family transcriptional regulator [Jiangellaceae bacterium]
MTSLARRRQIVEGAIDVLADGKHGTSFARIAERAGLSSPGLISYHFTDRRDLLAALLEYVDERRNAIIEAALAPGGSAAERLASLLTSDMEYLTAHPKVFAAVVEAFHELRDDEGRLAHLGRRSGAYDALVGLLREGQRSGEFADTYDAESLALLFDGARTQFLAQIHRRPDLDVDAFTRTLVGLALTAVEESRA